MSKCSAHENFCLCQHQQKLMAVNSEQRRKHCGMAVTNKTEKKKKKKNPKTLSN